MCSADGTEVRLGDFGLSTGNKWSKNYGAGTAGYMSPECIGYRNGPKAYSPQSNDVWSLGVILTSMISGHNPWKRAVMSDECFRAFLSEPDFLQNMLPISKTANRILQRIFAAPTRRVTLPKLRQLVSNADTFFMTDDEIAHSSPFVQWAAASYMGLHDSSSGINSLSASCSVDIKSACGGQIAEDLGGVELGGRVRHSTKRSQSLPPQAAPF